MTSAKSIRAGRGIRVAPLTLHVGVGTFAPVKVADPVQPHPAADELRSVNGQIEYLLRQAVARRKGEKAKQEQGRS
jgi:S-adenosylmethionine:tRNA-ribosyltransferase-isomerase (queuine synthetase)